MLDGFEIAIGMQDGAVFHEDGAADRAFALGVSVRSESAGPGDVAMTDRIERIAAFAENPTGAGVLFAQGKVIRGDVLLASGEAFLCGGKLVHQGEAEVVLFAREVDLEETAGKLFGGFPTDLTAETGFVAGALD